MKQTTFSDTEILEALGGNSSTENAALRFLYKRNINAIRHLMKTSGGKQDDAEDILQDAIIILYEKIKKGNFQLRSSLSTYIYSVCKFIWFNKSRKDKKVTHLDDFSFKESAEIVGDNFKELYHPSQENFIKELFSKIGEGCKEVLVLSIYQKYSMAEVAEVMNLKNAQIARNKKSLCLGKLKKLIEGSSRYQNTLKTLLNG